MSASQDQDTRDGNALACPHCLSPGFLGEYVIGWRELREMPRMVDGKARWRGDSSVYEPEHHAFFCSNQGCNVDRELTERQLVQIDRDGKPVPKQPKEQGRLA